MQISPIKTIALLSALTALTGCTGLKTTFDPETDQRAGRDALSTSEVDAEAKVQAQASATGDNKNLEEGATNIEMNQSMIPWISGTIIFCILAFCCRNISFSWQVDIEADKKKSIQRTPNNHLNEDK